MAFQPSEIFFSLIHFSFSFWGAQIRNRIYIMAVIAHLFPVSEQYFRSKNLVSIPSTWHRHFYNIWWHWFMFDKVVGYTRNMKPICFAKALQFCMCCGTPGIFFFIWLSWRKLIISEWYNITLYLFFVISTKYFATLVLNVEQKVQLKIIQYTPWNINKAVLQVLTFCGFVVSSW